jgi:probable selenium-dependent hydroxylase accessory protein YqeC
MKLKEALGIRGREVICLVGGGGKTTLMFGLAKELAAGGLCVITTTTTKILKPSPSETEKLILNNDEDALLTQLLQEINNHLHITIARGKLQSGKLEGITRKMAIRLSEFEQVSHIIIEADGAAHHSLKAPNDTEPVVPPNTSLVIAVAGIDAFGSRLEEETVFRADIAARLLQVPLGTIVSAELMATLITHPRGILKGIPDTARIVPFINKIDLDDGLAKARQVAREILVRGNSRINTVLLGQVQRPNPVVEIMHKEKL